MKIKNKLLIILIMFFICFFSVQSFVCASSYKLIETETTPGLSYDEFFELCISDDTIFSYISSCSYFCADISSTHYGLYFSNSPITLKLRGSYYECYCDSDLYICSYTTASNFAKYFFNYYEGSSSYFTTNSNISAPFSLSSYDICINGYSEKVVFEKNCDFPLFSDSPDKINLFELNMVDLDDNRKKHQFNICTYTNSDCYDELMNYYNNDYQYNIFITDYQRILTYLEPDNDNSFQYGSYILSGYIDFITNEDTFFYFNPNNKKIVYEKEHSILTNPNNNYSDISDLITRFYFKLTYSEDSDDPYSTIYSDNGNLFKYDENMDEPNFVYFIGGSTNIRYGEYGILSISQLSNKYYYRGGYLGNNPFRDISEQPFYIYDFYFAGGTTKLFFLDSSSYEKNIMDCYDNLMIDYMSEGIQQDSSEGCSYKYGDNFSTATFQPGEVTEDTSKEEAEKYLGEILTANNGSIKIDNDWTLLDYLSYFFNKDKYNEINSNNTKNSIVNSTNTIKDKFNFSNNIVNNANEIKDFLSNTQETHKYYLNINSKYLSGNICIIDLSWYEPYKPTVDAFILAFAYLAFIWHMFCRLPNIISGASASSYLSDIVAYKNTGFGRSSNIHKGGF